MLSDPHKRAAYDQYGHAGVDASMGRGAEGFGGFAEAFGDIFGDTSAMRAGAAPARRSTAAATSATRWRSRSRKRRAARRRRSHPVVRDVRDLQGQRRQAGNEPDQLHDLPRLRDGADAPGLLQHPAELPDVPRQRQDHPRALPELPRPGPDQEEQDARGQDPGGHQRRHAHPLERKRRAGPERRPERRSLHRDPHQAARHLRARRRRPALHRAGGVSAALGGAVEVPTLGGKAEIDLPEGTQHGKTFRLRGKGIKGVRSSYPGDLDRHVSVETPIKLTEHQRKLLKELDDSFRKSGDRHSPNTKTWSDRVKDLFKAWKGSNKPLVQGRTLPARLPPGGRGGRLRRPRNSDRLTIVRCPRAPIR